MSLFVLHVSLTFGLLLAAAAAGVVGLRRQGASDVVYGLSALAAAGGAGFAVVHGFLGESPAALALPGGLPGVGIRLRIDSLSLVFLVVVNAVAALVSLYAVGYGRHEHPGRVLALYPLFLIGMNVVLIADDAFTFLIGWEFMSLASWGMVAARHEDPEARRAAHLYLLMACGGAFALLFAFGVLAGHAGDYAFAAIRARTLTGWMPELALVLILIGTGSKAGLVPLHVWLPLAHPAAPSHVSALMSGVMTKVAIYGTIRLVFDLMPTPQWYWALPFLFAGISTALIGLLQALVERDLKRLLAFSTIENIGIIYVALGLAVAFTATHLAAPAAVALTAALFHVANHAVMKSLMFCGAGAVLHAAHSKDLEKLGGLFNRMPATGALMLIGAAAISALPPLNGFASEWMVFQAILASPALPVEGLRFLVPAVGAVLALVAALAAACFVRAYGIAFLGRPRSPEAAAAHEVDRVSLAAMALMAGLCIAGGVLAPLVVEALRPATLQLVNAGLPAQAGPVPLTLTPFDGTRSTYNGFMIAVFLLVSSFLASWGVHRIATRATRRAPAWDCGFPDASPATQYTASSLGQPIRRVFGPIALRVRQQIAMPPPGSTAPAEFRLSMTDPVWSLFYVPLARLVELLSWQFNILQFLTIRRYLTLMFAALVLLLVVVVLWR
ncbi:hydrogenase 4 subunit B [Blastochloris sulfoviridis]|uniref:Hydrogenase 4 subunit B n=1 Tax=Blastochloris sulfoviridis TaxID=50712 RepID=A0A5M6HUT9_9HYPH|nr:hydrogenase 4 subunit B [Blastochloris sulfoviridis]KAA5599611.1 hydrogenase 4 subunit B [Blastochloris sulfoviridis]